MVEAFEETKEELRKTFEGMEYKNELIRRTLTEKPKLRRTFAVLIIFAPARFGQLKEKLFFGKNTIYNYLYQLIELGLVKKISVMDLWNKKNLKGNEKIVMDNFKEWTKTMATGQVQYFAGKTNYFLLADLGRENRIIKWVLKLEQEFKNE